MTTPPTPPIIEYGHAAPRRKLSLWAFAAPLVAVAAFVLTVWVGAVLIGANHLIMAYIMNPILALAAISFSIYAIVRVRRARGRLVGITAAALAIGFSVCSGLLCPGFAGSLDMSRQLSSTIFTESQMRAIVRACETYAMDHDGHFPPHLAVLLTTGAIKPAQLLDRNAPIPLAPLPAARLAGAPDWRALAAEVEAHCDFTYIGGDLASTSDSDLAESGLIALYSKPGRIHKHMDATMERWDGQGRLVAFADGHSELILDRDLAAVFARSNAARARLKLPPVMLDGPPPR
jgi:hypothetical protein